MFSVSVLSAKLNFSPPNINFQSIWSRTLLEKKIMIFILPYSERVCNKGRKSLFFGSSGMIVEVRKLILILTTNIKNIFYSKK